MGRKKFLWIVAVLVLIIIIGLYFWRTANRDYKIIISEVRETTDTMPETFSIGTYNIKGLNRGKDLDKFVNDIKDLDLDVITLQEVDNKSIRSNNLEMVKEMAIAAGYDYYYFYKSMWILNGDYGLGIISKYPILNVSSEELPNKFLAEPRIFVGADIDVNGEIIHIYNTHLSYMDRLIRQDQLDFISDKIANQTNTIFMGDLNTFTVDDFLYIDGFNSVNHQDDIYYTYSDFAFTDNIYYSNDLTFIDAQVQKTSFSDHNLLYARLKLNEEE